MVRIQLNSLWLLCLLVGLVSHGYAQSNSKVVIHVDTEFPTQDKPQSKLWYMHETWWAMLPTTSGPSIWKRLGEEKWVLQDDITEQLKGMPGRADVQVEGTSVYAVVVDHARLSVLEIDASEQDNWTFRSVVNLEPLIDAEIETATIARTTNGALWVVADNGDRVVLWHRSEEKFWSEPYELASGISADDIATVTATSHEVQVIWSNQNLGFFEMRTHVIGEPDKQWSAPKILGKEKNIADDHLNIKVNQRNDEWMVTKNSHDGYGTDVFELWRKKEGELDWQYRSFAPLTPEIHPSRPAVILTDYPDIAFVGYTIYSKDKNKGIVQFSMVDVEDLSVGAPKIGIYSNAHMINDLTTAKQQYSVSAQAWIALASDKEGNVYEVDLRALLMPQIVKPLFITEPVAHDSDDPAIWIHPDDPSKSLILGTDKHADGGLYVFDLEGKIMTNKTIKGMKRPNNVDVAYGVNLAGKKTDIAVVSERLTGNLRIYSLPNMTPLDGGGIPMFEGEHPADYRALMGIATYTSPQGETYVIMGRKNGPAEGYLWQYLLRGAGDGSIKAELVRKFGRFSGTQEIESIAVDNELGYVYYSDEQFGVRKYDADPKKGNDELGTFGTSGFVLDHEGISIYQTSDTTGYILVSDQFGHRFRIFSREMDPASQSHHFIGNVYVEATLSDGSEVTSIPLNDKFRKGIFVVMSDDKTFHYYRWEDLMENLQLKD